MQMTGNCETVELRFFGNLQGMSHFSITWSPSSSVWQMFPPPALLTFLGGVQAKPTSVSFHFLFVLDTALFVAKITSSELRDIL